MKFLIQKKTYITCIKRLKKLPCIFGKKMTPLIILDGSNLHKDVYNIGRISYWFRGSFFL